MLRDKNSKFSKGVAFVQFNVKAQATSGKCLGCPEVADGGVLTLSMVDCLFVQR